MNKSNDMNNFFRIGGAAFATLLAAAMSLDAHAADNQLPPEQQSGAASYLSGGIGEGEAARFEAAFSHYPLIVQLYETQKGKRVYTADALVTIVDHNGKVVLEERAKGPFMLVRLPAGDYEVSASLKSHHLTDRRIHITDSGHAKAEFTFPQVDSTN